MTTVRDNRKTILLRAALILLITGAALFVLLRMTDRSWSDRYRLQETRETGNQAFMDEGIVEWNGNRYRKKPALTLILLAGIDKDGTEAPSPRVNYRNGGQADFLMMLAIDHGEKKIHQLQIDRALLNDLEIDGYYMVDYSAVPAMTDLVGGVPVTIAEDMTTVNSEWYKGHTITLTGADAETFVRTRKTVGSGTNAERMNRQAIYMQGVIRRIHENLSDDPDFASRMVSELHPIAVTDLTDLKLLEEINIARSYEVLPVDYLPGRYDRDSNDFTEFYPEEGSVTEWVMTHLYSLRQERNPDAME